MAVHPKRPERFPQKDGFGPVRTPRPLVFGMRTPFAILERIGKLYLAKVGPGKIAVEVGVTSATVRNFLHAAGLWKPKHGYYFGRRRIAAPAEWHFKPIGKGLFK